MPAPLDYSAPSRTCFLISSNSRTSSSLIFFAAIRSFLSRACRLRTSSRAFAAAKSSYRASLRRFARVRPMRCNSPTTKQTKTPAPQTRKLKQTNTPAARATLTNTLATDTHRRTPTFLYETELAHHLGEELFTILPAMPGLFLIDEMQMFVELSHKAVEHVLQDHGPPRRDTCQDVVGCFQDQRRPDPHTEGGYAHSQECVDH